MIANAKHQIEHLRITRNPTYASVNPDRFVAEVKFRSESGTIEIPLAPEIAEKLLAYIAPLLVEFSRRATEQISADIADQCRLLEAGPAITETLQVTSTVAA